LSPRLFDDSFAYVIETRPASANGDSHAAALDLVETRIMIVGRQRLVSEALGIFLCREPDMRVVANVVSVADSALRAPTVHPDVVIAEFKLDDGTAADVAHAMTRARCDAKTIFLAPYQSDNVLLAAMDVGASAVLYLSTPVAEVISAVRSVAAGLTLIGPPLVARLIGTWRLRDHLSRGITNREREILRLMADGVGNRDIAARLGVSYFTVRTHVRNVAAKLAARSQLEAVARAQQLDLLDTHITHRP
jgi:two-component system response regulator DevR